MMIKYIILFVLLISVTFLLYPNIIEGNENMNPDNGIKLEWEMDVLQKTMYNRLVSQFDKIDQNISNQLKIISLHLNEKSSDSKKLILQHIGSIMELYRKKQQYLEELPSLFGKNINIPEQREELLDIYNSLNRSNIEVTNEKISNVIQQYIDSKKNTLMSEIKDLSDDKAITTVKKNISGFEVYYNFMDQINEGISKYLSEEEKLRKSATNVGLNKDVSLKLSSK